MSALDAFLTEVRPWAPGVPDAVAFKSIRGAAIEFCERTRLWKYEDEFNITADDEGDIYTPNGSVLFDLEVMQWEGKDLEPIATRDLDHRIPHWRTTPASELSGLPQYVTQISLNQLKIVPIQAGSVYLCVRLKPDPNAMIVPDFLAQQYREVIGWGALGRLLTIPGQSYSNNDLAAYYKGLFEQKIDRLNTKGTTGQQNAPKRTRARFF